MSAKVNKKIRQVVRKKLSYDWQAYHNSVSALPFGERVKVLASQMHGLGFMRRSMLAYFIFVGRT
jgi:hypothetical protein